MRSSSKQWSWKVALLAGSAGLAVDARAADPKEWGDESAAEDEKQPEKHTATPVPGDAEGAAATSEDTAATESSAAPAASEDAPAEDAGTEHGQDTQLLLGARYRGLFIPAGVLHAFIEGGESVYVNGVGPELAIRHDDVEYVLSAWLALYDFGPVAVKGNSDAEEAWEIVESEMKAVYLTFDYLWHTPLSLGLELSYGGGAGLGILFGNLYRTQATLENGGTIGDPDDYVPCDGVNQPPQGGYCDDINDHYDGYGEPSWFNGGAKPSLYPWLAGQIGLRYQPHAKFVARLDLGLGTSGLFFGVGADYAL
jgi:hypothetical protein